MARFKLAPNATLRQLGEKVQELATMSTADYSAAAANPSAIFSSILDLPASMKLVLVKDEANLRHIIVPYYTAPPSPGAAEMGGVVVFCGCAE